MQTTAGDQETMWDAVPEQHDEQAALESDDSSTTAYEAPASTSHSGHADDDTRYTNTQLPHESISHFHVTLFARHFHFADIPVLHGPATLAC